MKRLAFVTQHSNLLSYNSSKITRDFPTEGGSDFMRRCSLRSAWLFILYAVLHDRLPSDRSRPTRPGRSGPPDCLRPAPIVHGTPRRGGAPSAQTAATERDAAGGHCSTEPTPQRCRTIACRRKDHDPPALAAPARRPACAPPQGPDERMRVRSTGAAAALGVAPRGASRCCRPHQSVRSTLEPSPCRRAPLPTRTRSSAIACLAAAAVAVRASLRCRNGLWHALASAVPPLLGSVDGSYTSEHSR